MRKIKTFVWVDADDCNPPHGLDMESPRDADKVAMLQAAFEKDGFDPSYPALVGYPLEGKIQLLSGTHRHMAGKLAGVKLPVTLFLRSDVEETWGTDWWDNTIADIPVSQLEAMLIEEGKAKRSPYDPVNLSDSEES